MQESKMVLDSLVDIIADFGTDCDKNVLDAYNMHLGVWRQIANFDIDKQNALTRKELVNAYWKDYFS